MSTTSTPTTPTARAGGAARRLWASLLVDGRPRLRELAIYTGLMAIVAVVLLGQHVTDAGWASDDWAYRSVWVNAESKGFWGQLDKFIHLPELQGRPTLAVYLSFVQQAFGPRQGAHLAWAAVLGVVFSAVVYLLLRTLRMRRLDAGLIGLLVFVFPASDSTRIWAMISDASVAMSLALLGVFCVLRSLQVDGRRAAIALRVGGSVLMVLGVTTYELTFAALLGAFLLYRTEVGWKRTLQNAAIDWVVLGLTYILVLSNSSAEHLPLSDAIDHGWEVMEQVFRLIATVALPFDSPGAAMAICGAIVLAALVVARKLPAGDATRALLTRWLWTALLAAVFIAAAYVVYGPAALFYQPLAPGVLNRTNAFGALPIVVFIYALVAMLATMIFRGLREERAVAAVATAAVALLLAVDYTSSMVNHLKVWDSGYNRAHIALDKFTAMVDAPPHQALIVMYGQPIQEAQNIPVWMHWWDITGAMQLTYHDKTLRGRAAFPGTRIECRKVNAVLHNDAYANVVLATDDAPYGALYLFDANSGVLAVPKTKRECEEVAPKFVPAPMVAADPGAFADR